MSLSQNLSKPSKKLKKNEKYKFELYSILFTKPSNLPWNFIVELPVNLIAAEETHLWLTIKKIFVNEMFSPWSSLPNILLKTDPLFSTSRVSIFQNCNAGISDRLDYSFVNTLFYEKNFNNTLNQTTDTTFCVNSQYPLVPSAPFALPMFIGQITSNFDTNATNFLLDTAYYTAHFLPAPQWPANGWFLWLVDESVADFPYNVLTTSSGILVEDWNDSSQNNNWCGFWGLPTGSLSVSQNGDPQVNLLNAYNFRHNEINAIAPSLFNRIPSEQPFAQYAARAYFSDQLAPNSSNYSYLQGIWVYSVLTTNRYFVIPLNLQSFAPTDYFNGYRLNQVIIDEIEPILINTQQIKLMSYISPKADTRGACNNFKSNGVVIVQEVHNTQGTFSEPAGVPFGIENDITFQHKLLRSNNVNQLSIQFLADDGVYYVPLADNSNVTVVGEIICE